jgi:xanthine dehydrogenase YagT iron-sulfur-binding subunit
MRFMSRRTRLCVRSDSLVRQLHCPRTSIAPGFTRWRERLGLEQGGTRLEASTHLPVTLTVNGSRYPLLLEPRRTLLDALRHDLGLTGTKKVCDMGDCGACTVIVDGRAMYACLLLAVDCGDRKITTIEGLGHGNALDPVQEAFIEEDAFQCGFCTSGQVMSLRALLDAYPNPNDAQILRAVSGNLCRCGAYRNILAAGRLAADLQLQAQTDQLIPPLPSHELTGGNI